MNGITIYSSCGVMALVAAAAVTAPPAATETQSATTATHQFFIAAQVDTVDPPKGRWEADLKAVGMLSIVVDSHGRQVLLNNTPLPPDRVIWQPHNLVMIVDEQHQRQFEVALGENGRIDYIRPGTWLDLRGADAPRVAIGIFTDPVSPPLAAQLGLDPEKTLLVKSVVENMPAFKSGVHQFDIITAVDDQNQVTQETLRNVIFSKEPGQSIQLRLIRRSQPVELTVSVEAVQGPEPNEGDSVFSIPSGEDWPFLPQGLITDELTGLQIDNSDRPVIQFGNSGSAIVLFNPNQPRHVFGAPVAGPRSGIAVSDSADDLQVLAARIEALTERIASLEALLRRRDADDRRFTIPRP